MRFKNIAEVDEFIRDIDGPVVYKNSHDYFSNDWRMFDELDIAFPVQRMLSKRECVFDFDNVCAEEIKPVLDSFDEQGFRYIAYQTSYKGFHVHFWTNLEGKLAKKYLVKHLAGIIKAKFDINVDTQPMGHGFVRAEFSIHPKKKTIKEPFKSNLNRLFYINEVPHSLIEKVLPESTRDGLINGLNRKVNGKTPSCVKYMLSHKFADGRERMVFALVSWFKANGMKEAEVVAQIKRWAKLQDYYIAPSTIRAKFNSSSAEVGCTFRHELLEELGVDMTHCKLEEC